MPAPVQIAPGVFHVDLLPSKDPVAAFWESWTATRGPWTEKLFEADMDASMPGAGAKAHEALDKEKARYLEEMAAADAKTYGSDKSLEVAITHESAANARESGREANALAIASTDLPPGVVSKVREWENQVAQAQFQASNGDVGGAEATLQTAASALKEIQNDPSIRTGPSMAALQSRVSGALRPLLDSPVDGLPEMTATTFPGQQVTGDIAMPQTGVGWSPPYLPDGKGGGGGTRTSTRTSTTGAPPPSARSGGPGPEPPGRGHLNPGGGTVTHQGSAPTPETEEHRAWVQAMEDWQAGDGEEPEAAEPVGGDSDVDDTSAPPQRPAGSSALPDHTQDPGYKALEESQRFIDAMNAGPQLPFGRSNVGETIYPRLKTTLRPAKGAIPSTETGPITGPPDPTSMPGGGAWRGVPDINQFDDVEDTPPPPADTGYTMSDALRAVRNAREKDRVVETWGEGSRGVGPSGGESTDMGARQGQRVDNRIAARMVEGEDPEIAAKAKVWEELGRRRKKGADAATNP